MNPGRRSLNFGFPRGRTPPDAAGRKHFESRSPDGRWTLTIDDAMEMRMGGSWRGRGNLGAPGRSSTDLGVVGLPSSVFVPWLGRDRAIWMNRRGIPFLIPLAEPTSGTRLCTVKGELLSIVCHRNSGVAIRMFGWYRRALTIFNTDGEEIGAFEHKNLHGACGYSADGSAIIGASQQDWTGPFTVHAFNTTTGALLGSTALDEIDTLPSQHIESAASDMKMTRPDDYVSIGSDLRTLKARFDAARGTINVGFEVVTGEVLERFGEPHAVAETAWIEIGVVGDDPA